MLTLPPARRLRPLALALALALLAPAAFASTYTVQAGDSLWSISRRTGVSVGQLRAWNGLSGDTIRRGQVLRLSGRASNGGGSAASSGAGQNAAAGVPLYPYTVRRGDTLAGIAARAGIGVGDLRRANGMGGDFLAVGQRLRVPARPLPAAPVPAGQEVRVFYGYVKVGAGETLDTLAARYRTTPAEIMAANYLRGAALYPGQRLRVPKRVAVPVPPTPRYPPVSLHRRTPLGVPVTLVRVDLRHRGVLVAPVLPRAGKAARVGTLSKESGADALINGGYFHPRSYAPAGDLVRSGQLVAQGRIPAALAITPDNRASIRAGFGSGASAWRGMETVVASGPRILVGGRLRTDYNPAFRDPAVFGRAARSAVGLSGDRDLLLVTTKARLTTTEMAKVMRQLGAQNALLLDGGSSAGLAWRGQAVSDSVRAVAFGIGVYGNYAGRRYAR